MTFIEYKILCHNGDGALLHTNGFHINFIMMNACDQFKWIDQERKETL